MSRLDDTFECGLLTVYGMGSLLFTAVYVRLPAILQSLPPICLQWDTEVTDVCAGHAAFTLVFRIQTQSVLRVKHFPSGSPPATLHFLPQGLLLNP